MMEFSKRSYQLEMLDMPIKDDKELRKNLNEISIINKLLGGDQVTFKGLKRLMINREKTYKIVDIGCGEGGLLRRIWHWANKNRFSVEILGIDIEPDAIHYAKEKSKKYNNLHFQVISYDEYFDKLVEKPDIIISSLFCHHLDELNLPKFLSKMIKYSRIGFIINDLHRNFFAYYSIKILTQLFSRSKYTKNDAPISVLRGFTKSELKTYFQNLSHIEYDLSWQWAFRYLVVARNNNSNHEGK